MGMALNLGWFFVFVGSLLGVASGIFIIVSLFNMKEGIGIKKGIFLLFLASVCIISYSTLVAIFGLVEYNIEEKLWTIIPVIYFLAGIFYLSSTYYLMQGIREIQKEK